MQHPKSDYLSSSVLGPGKFVDLYRVKNTKMSLDTRKRLNNAIDIGRESIGPDPVRMAVIMATKDRDDSLLWAEEVDLVLGKREGILDALRRNLSKIDSSFKGPLPTWDKDFSVGDMDYKTLIQLPKTWEAQNVFYRRYDCMRTSECIGLSSPLERAQILWEKRRRNDLIELKAANSRIAKLTLLLAQQEVVNKNKIDERTKLHTILHHARNTKNKELDVVILALIRISKSLDAEVAEAQFRGYNFINRRKLSLKNSELKDTGKLAVHGEEVALEDLKIKPQDSASLMIRIESQLKPKIRPKLVPSGSVSVRVSRKLIRGARLCVSLKKRVEEKKDINVKFEKYIQEMAQNRKNMAITLGITAKINPKIDPEGCLTREANVPFGKRSGYSKDLLNLHPIASLDLLDGIHLLHVKAEKIHKPSTRESRVSTSMQEIHSTSSTIEDNVINIRPPSTPHLAHPQKSKFWNADLHGAFKLPEVIPEKMTKGSKDSIFSDISSSNEEPGHFRERRFSHFEAPIRQNTTIIERKMSQLYTFTPSRSITQSALPQRRGSSLIPLESMPLLSSEIGDADHNIINGGPERSSVVGTRRSRVIESNRSSIVGARRYSIMGARRLSVIEPTLTSFIESSP